MADDVVTLVDIVALKRQFPQLDNVKDWATNQTIRLLWDRVFALQEQLTAAQTNVRLMATALNTMNAQVLSVEQLAKGAYALVQIPADSTPPPGAGPEECPDDGEAAHGVNDAGPNGDVGVVPLDAYQAGIIIGGTANEYSYLLNVAIDAPTRDANIEELLLRMIWHLNQAGFVAGRQRNPSSAISKDKLTIEIGGETFAYDVFQGVDFTEPVPVQAGRVCPADYVADAGIPD